MVRVNNEGCGPGMRLSPREREKLELHAAGALAQKRLARGLRLNHPEAVALIAAQVLEFIRDGRPVAELMDLGRRLLGRNQVCLNFIFNSFLIPLFLFYNPSFFTFKLTRNFISYSDSLFIFTNRVERRVKDYLTAMGENSAHTVRECDAQVMDGVAELIDEVQVEGTFPDGTKLVTVHSPIALMDGDMELALYGSFLPVPERKSAPLEIANKAHELPASQMPGVEVGSGEGIGAILPSQEPDIVLNPGREICRVKVTSLCDRPIQVRHSLVCKQRMNLNPKSNYQHGQVGSHYHFSEVNPQLQFDRVMAYGKRLNIPAGTAVRYGSF